MDDQGVARRAVPGPALLSLFAVSGACGLVYEVVWTRWLGLVAGSFPVATATAVTVFMAGMALGYAVFGRLAQGCSPRAALRLYALLEAGIALLGALSPLLFGAGSWLYDFLAAVSPLPVARAAAAGLLLFLPAVLMGGTLPAVVVALGAGRSRRLGVLYALNTGGAAAGPLVAVFLLMPAFGLAGTAFTAAATNALIAAIAFRLARTLPAGADPLPPEPPAGPGEPAPVPPWVAYCLAGSCGMLSLAYEMTLARFIILTVTGGSVYGLAIILSSFLAGMATGSGLNRLAGSAATGRKPAEALRACAVAFLLPWAFSLTLPLWDQLPGLLYLFWSGYPSFIATQFFAYACAFALSLVVAAGFGYALPALADITRANGGREVGRLFGANTLGAIAGAPVAGFLLIPVLGIERTMSALGAGSLAAAGVALAFGRPRARIAAALLVPLGAVLSFIVPVPEPSPMSAALHFRPFRFSAIPVSRVVQEMAPVVHQEDGITARIAVQRRSTFYLALLVNGKPDSSSSLGDRRTMMLPAHIVMNYRRNVRDCLVIGLGAGFTVGSVLSYPVESLTCVEIEPAVYRAAALFSHINGRGTEDRRFRMVFDDGRHSLARHADLYDAIISEPSNLYVAGMANLYTREFYELALSRLKPGGIFSQWVHYYGADIGDCRTAIRTFGAVFPEFALWYHEEGDFFLVGSREPLVVDVGRFQDAFKDPRVAGNLATLECRNGQELASHMLMDGQDAMLFAGPGGMCTDNLPSLEFSTPLAMNIADISRKNLAIFMAFRPRNPVPLVEETHEKRLALGVLHESRGALGRALAEYRQAIRLSPADGAAWWRLARVLDWMGETERARGAVQKGLLVNPGSPILAGLRAKLGSGARKDPLDNGPEGSLTEGR